MKSCADSNSSSGSSSGSSGGGSSGGSRLLLDCRQVTTIVSGYWRLWRTALDRECANLFGIARRCAKPAKRCAGSGSRRPATGRLPPGCTALRGECAELSGTVLKCAESARRGQQREGGNNTAVCRQNATTGLLARLLLAVTMVHGLQAKTLRIN